MCTTSSVLCLVNTLLKVVMQTNRLPVLLKFLIEMHTYAVGNTFACLIKSHQASLRVYNTFINTRFHYTCVYRFVVHCKFKITAWHVEIDAIVVNGLLAYL